MATDAHTVEAGIEDEQHHFRVRLHHDGERVTGVEGRAVRWPWAPCAESPAALEAAVGVALTTDPTALGRHTPARLQCTHQFDLLGLAIGHAAAVAAGARPSRRQYDAAVPDWRDPPFTAELQRDGHVVLRWTCDASTIVQPTPFAGVSLREKFIEWCAASLDTDTAEAALVLRRAVWMSPSRLLDLEACDDALESALRPGVCFTAQPERIRVALRNRDSLRDFGSSAGGLVAGL